MALSQHEKFTAARVWSLPCLGHLQASRASPRVAQHILIHRCVPCSVPSIPKQESLLPSAKACWQAASAARATDSGFTDDALDTWHRRAMLGQVLSRPANFVITHSRQDAGCHTSITGGAEAWQPNVTVQVPGAGMPATWHADETSLPSTAWTYSMSHQQLQHLKHAMTNAAAAAACFCLASSPSCAASGAGTSDVSATAVLVCLIHAVTRRLHNSPTLSLPCAWTGKRCSQSQPEDAGARHQRPGGYCSAVWGQADRALSHGTLLASIWLWCRYHAPCSNAWCWGLCPYRQDSRSGHP